MNEPIEFFAPGDPQPQGSKKAFYVKALGRAVITESCAKLKPWRSVVSLIAQAAMNGKPLVSGPISVQIYFTFSRPKSHFGTGRMARILKTAAPGWKTGKPDIDKLARGVLDAMTGIVYGDDSQVVSVAASKAYGLKPGAQIKIWSVEE